MWSQLFEFLTSILTVQSPKIEEEKKPSIDGAHQLSENGVSFIKKWESFTPKAFWDYKQWSIGYGTKAKSKDEVISEPEAAKRLGEEASKAAYVINKYITVPLTQNQFDALVSFSYNIGTAWMTSKSSSVYKHLMAKQYAEAAQSLLLYNKTKENGKYFVNKGLVNRRNAEMELYLTT